MSNQINEDALPLPPAARKTAAKKTAVKKVAKKAPAKKTVAIEIPVISPEIELAPVKTSRAKKKVAALEMTLPVIVEAPAPEIRIPAKRTSRTIGRVPGGGPTTPREVAPAEAPSPEENPPPTPAVSSIPFPTSPPPNPQNPPSESRSKRRREKRKRRDQERRQQGNQAGGNQPQQKNQQRQRPEQSRNRQDQQNDHHSRHDSTEQEDRRPVGLDGPKIETNGILELAIKGFGFLRMPKKNFEQARDDVFVSPELIRKYNLRQGQWLHGLYQNGSRGAQLVELTTINDLEPEASAKLPHFDELKAINPTRRISFETTPERYTTRVIDIMAPVGRGQRGLIVSPPRSGKTTLLLHMAEAIREKYDEAIHLMVVLVDERPEEVTEFRRALPGAEIFASSNDEQARNHCRIAELAIERAKRLVESGKDVFLLMDSITRLARAYNGNMNNRGRGTGSGGITIGALEIPRRLFAAARNTRGGGSLTILATALIQTNSRADEAIFMEFKGTGNMELVLDRKIAENYIYPAVDIFKSGTRREEILLADHMLHKIHLIRRGLSGHRPAEAMERLLFFLKKFPNNPQMLMEIKG